MKNFIVLPFLAIFRVFNTARFALKRANEYVETNGYDQNVCLDIAFKQVANKPNVIVSRREELLMYMILRELRRRRVYNREGDNFSVEITRSYLQRGFVYFGDLGFSSDSLFSFFELGRITPGMYQELKNVHTRWRQAFDMGEDRRQELQRQIYDNLMSKRMDFLFASLP